jgi:hypothetical protein
MQTSRLNSSLKFEVDPYQLIGPINAHGVGSRQAGVEVKVPKKVGRVIAMRPVAIAGQSATEEEAQALHGWIFGLPCSLPKSSRSVCHPSGNPAAMRCMRARALESRPGQLFSRR